MKLFLTLNLLSFSFGIFPQTVSSSCCDSVIAELEVLKKELNIKDTIFVKLNHEKQKLQFRILTLTTLPLISN